MAPVRDRGQLILIGALSLAVSLVVIALVLNSAIYTHNLASRYDSAADGPVTFTRDVRAGAGGLIEHVNEVHGDDGYGSVGASDTILNAYVSGLPDVAATAANANAIDSRIVRVTHVSGSAVEGVRLIDTVPGGSSFHPATGTPTEWTVASDVRVRRFGVGVQGGLSSRSAATMESFLDGDLLDATDPAFAIEFDDGSSEWQVAIYDDGGPTVMVHEEGTSVYRTCSAASTPAELDFADARFGGQSCTHLTFIDDLDGTFDVRYYYGDRITGRYELTADLPVDGPGSEVGPFTDLVDTANYGNHCGNGIDGDGIEQTFHPATSGSSPRISPAVYATSVESTYETDQVTYRGVQRVAPAEPGPRPVSPRVRGISVVDASSNETDFTVTVDATDPDGNLTSVQAELVGTTSDSTSFTPPVESGSATLSLTQETTGTYTIRVTVTDADGNSRTVEQEHATDGDSTGCPA